MTTQLRQGPAARAGPRRRRRSAAGRRRSSTARRPPTSSESSTSTSSVDAVWDSASEETIAPSMSVVRCGGRGSRCRPVIEASAFRQDVPRMLPISRRADSPISLPASTPSSRQSASAPCGSISRSTTPSMSPSSGMTTLVVASSGLPHASTASARGRARTRGTFSSTSRPSICAERGRGVTRGDVRQLPQRIQLQFGVARGH